MADGATTAANRRGPRRERAPTTPDPIEIAMEAVADGAGPNSHAVMVLRKHVALIGWQIASERAGFALKVLTGAAGVALAAAIGVAAWQASQASGAVIEPFDTAPSLIAAGLSGEAVANEVLGRVRAMQAMAPTTRAMRRSSNAADQLNVVIPQTGVSIGEAQRLMRRWLGHETIVSGALRPAPGGGLTGTLRIDGQSISVPAPGVELIGSSEAWLDALAEATFRRTDPFRYSGWLRTVGRTNESEAQLWRLVRTGLPSERAWAWAGLATALDERGDFDGASAAARTAVLLDPQSAVSRYRLYEQYGVRGRDEQARYWIRQAVNTSTQRDRKSYLSFSARARGWDNDWLGVSQDLTTRLGHQAWGAEDFHPATISNWGRAYARLHQPTLAAQTLHLEEPLRDWLSLAAAAAVLDETQDWPALEALMQRPWPSPSPIDDLAERSVRWPWRAYAAARLGRADEALALVGRTPGDCYLCLRVRGRIAAIAGQQAEADRWLSEAVRQGPSLADAEFEWAEVKRGRGDRSGALALAQAAAQKAPRWADPLKLQGDLALASGDAKTAARKYAAAGRLAPQWGGLHLKWGQALARLGKADQARAQWMAAAQMDLTPADRAELARAQGGG